MRTRAAVRRSLVPAILALAIPLSASPGGAGAFRFDLDPATSRITFELGATMHTVRGTAVLSEGHVEFDPESGAASGRIRVAATSLSTDHESRDAKMHAEVIESTDFPEIAFEPHAVSGDLRDADESALRIDGAFTIHGETHPLSLEVRVRLDGESLTAVAEFDVPYVAWGMKDPSRFVMRAAKEVRVRIEGSGRLVPLEQADER